LTLSTSGNLSHQLGWHAEAVETAEGLVLGDQPVFGEHRLDSGQGQQAQVDIDVPEP